LSTRRRLPLLTACAAALVVAAPGVAATAGTGPDDDRRDAHREARAILASRDGDDRGQFKARTNVEVVPSLVELEVAVPRLAPPLR